MIMTPIHTRHGETSVRLTGLTISGHLLGMDAFSLWGGCLVDWVARAPVQGLADLVQGLTAAVGGALAGLVVGWRANPALALSCLPSVAVVAACGWLLARGATPVAEGGAASPGAPR